MRNGFTRMAAILVTALFAFAGLAIAQDTASPNTSSAQSQSEHERHEATAHKTGKKGTESSEANASGSQLSAKDKAFMKKAAQGGQEEVEIGQMIADKAKSDDVKQFAQRMVQDHTKATDELKSLAQQKGVTLPTEMDAQGKALKAQLERLTGDQIDKAYMKSMVKDHTKDVREFKMESQSAKDSDVKSFASKTLPTLESHLQLAKQTASKVGVSANQGTQTAQQ
jgi:putative membrane protein